ncbi:unnamed protein product, partial [Ectocarpus sp. 4 AP-2014]
PEIHLRVGREEIDGDRGSNGHAHHSGRGATKARMGVARPSRLDGKRMRMARTSCSSKGVSLYIYCTNLSMVDRERGREREAKLCWMDGTQGRTTGDAWGAAHNTFLRSSPSDMNCNAPSI